MDVALTTAPVRQSNRSLIVLNLFESYYNRVYCFTRQSLPPGQAEDVAQDVFVKLLEHRKLEEMDISVSYLLKIADNLIKRKYRRLQRFTNYLTRTGPSLKLSTSGPDSNGRKLESQIDNQELDRDMKKLTSEERDAVRFIISEGMSYEAAASSMNVPVTTLNNWKFRGLKKLKESSDDRQYASAKSYNYNNITANI